MKAIDADKLAERLNEKPGYMQIDRQDVCDAINEVGIVEIEPIKWIGVKDRLPEQDGEYLVLTESGDIFSITYDSMIDEPEHRFGIWEQHYNSESLGYEGEVWNWIVGITHWMPLPDRPEDECDAD